MHRTILVGLFLCSAHARADVIGAGWSPPQCPPLTCVPGTSVLGSGSHSSCSPGCGPNAECAEDADCTASYGDGARCIETRMCLATVHGRRGEQPVVRGECAADGTCADGECSSARRCERA